MNAEEFESAKKLISEKYFINGDNKIRTEHPIRVEDLAFIMWQYAEHYHQEKMKQNDALVQMMKEDERDGLYQEQMKEKETEQSSCLHCDGWGYTVDENGRRKEHCYHCE